MKLVKTEKPKIEKEENKRSNYFCRADINKRPHIWFSFGRWRYYCANGWIGGRMAEAFVKRKNFEIDMSIHNGSK